jgi:chromate transporter
MHQGLGRDAVPLAEALRFWARLGFINFGGPTGQIAIMHDELVERRRWIEEDRFLHALNFAMVLPGPEAHQLAIYIGWLLNGAPGAMAAGVFFVLPALVLMIGLSWIYAVHGDVAWISAVFSGLAWAVVGIVAAALVRIAKRTLATGAAVVLAALAFTTLFLCGVPFPAIIIVVGLIGFALHERVAPEPRIEASPGDARRRDTIGSRRRAIRVLLVGLTVWLVPLAIVSLSTGTDGVIAKEATFFAVMSLVTFGGAYAVLAYVNQAAVMRFGWLGADEMAVGLSLAETTPGPLILVVVFVGFLAAFRNPGDLDPVAAGALGAIVTAWATFVPSFIAIFLGAPSVERLRENERLAAVLAAITAAVVGVIANLALVFAISVLFDRHRTFRIGWHDVVAPIPASVDVLGCAVMAAALAALLRYRVNVLWVIVGGAAGGLVRFAAT